MKTDNISNIHDLGLDIKNRVVYTNSEFEHEESFLDFRMSIRFIKNLDILKSISNEMITVKIASYGGCWNYGMAMYDAVKKLGVPTLSISYAHARSMSSILPQAFDTRLIAKNCDFMVHNGTLNYPDSDYRAVVSSIEHTKKTTEVMLDVYAERCVNGPFFKERKTSLLDTKEFIRHQIEKNVDWWMTAEESIYYGFMDAIL